MSFLLFFIFQNPESIAACGGTSITWAALASGWNTAGNWAPNNVPNTATEDATIIVGTPSLPDADILVGCISLSANLGDAGASQRLLTFKGDSFSSTAANGIVSTKTTIVMGPHTTAGLAQTFSFNQSTSTLNGLTVATASVPGGGAFGATITNTNAGTGTITTLSNTGLNSSKYVGKITATTYTNAIANSVDVNGGTFTVNNLDAANTVTGGSLNVNAGGTFKTTTTFNPVAGFTTTVNSGSPLGVLTVTTTSAPAGTLVVNGNMTTTQFNPTATSTTTIGSGGSITASTSSTPLGTLNISGTLTSPTFAPATGTTTINSGGLISATTSSIPAATATLSISGTLTTPTFTPASGAIITVNNGGSLNATTTSAPGANITVASGGTFTVGTYSPASTSTTNISGTMTVTTFTPAAGATINVKSGGILNVTTFTPNATSAITVEAGGTLNITTMTNTLAATVSIFGTATVTNLPSISTGTLDVKNGGRLKFTNGLTVNGATVKIQAGGTIEIANTKTITLTTGNFQILGTEDAFPQSIATKGVVEALAGGTFNFTTTGGTLSLTGFHFDRLGVNGLNIGGTTIVSNLRGGQLSHLSTSYSSVKAIQLNNSGTLPVAATNIAWNWGAFNDFTGTNPTSAQGYKLVSSTGCSSQSIDFTGWTGDWYEAQPTFDVSTKVSAVSCTISLSGSASAVSLLSFDAVPFNAAIDLRWRTNAERNHLGFNVYRSDIYSAKFQQINKSLIRNLKSSGSNQASYRFIDQDVTNNQIYYYYIEDVEVSGKKVLHGPVSATPLVTLGVPPADNADENSETNPNDTDDGGTTSLGPIPNPSYEDLGNGVVIISKTSRSIRLEITPESPIFAASAWSNSYQDVSITGYSKMTSVGSPELPEKDILIEVQRFAQTAQINKVTVTENTLGGHLISPAPNYSLNGSGVLVPSYSPGTDYGSSTNYPTDYYFIQTDLVSGNNTKFLKLKINPLKLNPVLQSITMATKIILDIGLDGDDWDVNVPNSNSAIGVYSVSNTLKIDYTKSGFYQVNYDDFVSSEVEGPFVNKSTNLWRLYYKDTEVPMEIHSPTGSFSAGDYIRFYTLFTKEIESKKNQLILSPVNLTNNSSAPLRIESIEANPTDQTDSSEVLTTFTKVFEQNVKYIDGVTLNDSLDHFFYADLVNYPGMDSLSITTTLPEIDVTSSTNVQVKYYVRGRLGMSGLPVKHNITLSVGANIEGGATFEENSRQVLTFEIPADRFTTGDNTLKLKVTGAFAPATDNDFILVDKVEIVYKGFINASADTITFSLVDTMKNHTIKNFSSNQIFGYDITFPFEVRKLTNMLIATTNGGASFNSTFLVDDQVDANNLKSFTFLMSNIFLKPSGLSLNSGIGQSLKNSANRADLIIYGSENLIDAAKDLIDRRASQGLEVVTVTPEQVYSEFSYGIQKSKALKDFINTALSSWEKPPRFLLILGDGTYDPLDYNVNALANNDRSVLEKSTLPAPLIPGRFIDFSSDNFFVSSDISHMPKLSVGRLPTNDPQKIKNYIDKIRKYEDGEVSPTNSLKKISFFADEDTGNYEHFNLLSQSMMSSADGFSKTLYDRTILGSKALTKAKINSEFNDGPLIISMMGHGAFDRFGDDIFNVSDADLLTNSILPIVAAWNCETAYFYDADKTYKSLGEELIFNPNGGAIVFMGSTTQTTPPAQSRLAQSFFSQFSSVIKNPWTGARLGDLLYQAKIGVGDGLYEKDIINSFSIIGDPSLKLPSNLFPANPEAAKAPTASKKKGLFGCAANAGEDVRQTPWHEGFLEWILYMFLIVYGTRKVLRMTHE